MAIDKKTLNALKNVLRQLEQFSEEEINRLVNKNQVNTRSMQDGGFVYPEDYYHPLDIDKSGAVNIADLVYMINFILTDDSGSEELCSSDLLGCDGVCFSGLVFDECGECGGLGPELGFDCDGNCLQEVDCLGVCGGDAVEDCSGECNGDAEFDECGVCGGDNSSCSGCTDTSATNYNSESTINNGCQYNCGGPGQLPCSGEDETCVAGQPNECQVIVSVVPGCTDPSACNHDSEATEDDGSCQYPPDCYDCNGDCICDIDEDGICDTVDDCVGYYDSCGVCNGDGPEVVCWNGQYVCLNNNCPEEPVYGCTYPDSCNYDETANIDDGSCQDLIYCCLDENDNGRCDLDENGEPIIEEWCTTDCNTSEGWIFATAEGEILGCTHSSALNYNENATQDDNSCEYPEFCYNTDKGLYPDFDGYCRDGNYTDDLCATVCEDETSVDDCNGYAASNVNPLLNVRVGSCTPNLNISLYGCVVYDKNTCQNDLDTNNPDMRDQCQNLGNDYFGTIEHLCDYGIQSTPVWGGCCDSYYDCDGNVTCHNQSGYGNLDLEDAVQDCKASGYDGFCSGNDNSYSCSPSANNPQIGYRWDEYCNWVTDQVGVSTSPVEECPIWGEYTTITPCASGIISEQKHMEYCDVNNGDMFIEGDFTCPEGCEFTIADISVQDFLQIEGEGNCCLYDECTEGCDGQLHASGTEPVIDFCGKCTTNPCTGIDPCGRFYGGWASEVYDPRGNNTAGPNGPCSGIDDCGNYYGGWVDNDFYMSTTSSWSSSYYRFDVGTAEEIHSGTGSNPSVGDYSVSTPDWDYTGNGLLTDPNWADIGCGCDYNPDPEQELNLSSSFIYKPPIKHYADNDLNQFDYNTMQPLNTGNVDQNIYAYFCTNVGRIRNWPDVSNFPEYFTVLSEPPDMKSYSVLIPILSIMNNYVYCGQDGDNCNLVDGEQENFLAGGFDLGCTDKFAHNYSSLAKIDDGTCYYHFDYNDVVFIIPDFIYLPYTKSLVQNIEVSGIELSHTQLYFCPTVNKIFYTESDVTSLTACTDNCEEACELTEYFWIGSIPKNIGLSHEYEYIFTENNGIQYSDNVDRTVYKDRGKPTFVIDHPFDYTENPLNFESNLPIVKINESNNSLTIYDRQFDIMNNIDDDIINVDMIVESITKIDNDTKSSYEVLLSGDDAINVAGLKKQNGFILDSMVNDKTLVKTDFSRYVLEQMGESYLDNKYIELFIENADGMEYRGTYIMRELPEKLLHPNIPLYITRVLASKSLGRDQGQDCSVYDNDQTACNDHIECEWDSTNGDCDQSDDNLENLIQDDFFEVYNDGPEIDLGLTNICFTDDKGMGECYSPPPGSILGANKFLYVFNSKCLYHEDKPNKQTLNCFNGSGWNLRSPELYDNLICNDDYPCFDIDRSLGKSSDKAQIFDASHETLISKVGWSTSNGGCPSEAHVSFGPTCLGGEFTISSGNAGVCYTELDETGDPIPHNQISLPTVMQDDYDPTNPLANLPSLCAGIGESDDWLYNIEDCVNNGDDTYNCNGQFTFELNDFTGNESWTNYINYFLLSELSINHNSYINDVIIYNDRGTVNITSADNFSSGYYETDVSLPCGGEE